MNRLKAVLANRNFWILAILLGVLGLVHYLTPQVIPLPWTSHTLSRRAVDRIIFLLPAAGAALAFGQAGGLIALALAVLIMLPRVFILSPYPGDAMAEVLGVGLVGYLVVWVIESQEREKRLRQEVASRLRSIGAVTSIVTSSLELEHILDGALDKVLEVMRVKVAAVYLLTKETDQLVVAAYRGMSPARAREADPIALGESLTGQVGQSGEPVVLGDFFDDPGLAACLEGAEGMRSFVAVPLSSSDGVLGVLTLADSRRHQFTPQDVHLLTAICGQVGVAIENARLHQDVEHQLRIEQRLNKIAERLASDLELDRILPRALEIAEELIGADGAIIALFDEESNLVGYPYLHNLPQSLARITASEETGLAWEVMAAGRPAEIEDYAAHPRAVPAFVQAGVTSLATAPLVSGDRSFGTLAVVTIGRARAFSDRDIAMLASIGRQAGIAIDNARLYENMRFYARQITRAQEDERMRIARDLHDETIQMLIVISRRIEALAAVEQMPDSTLRLLVDLQDLVSETLKELRRFIKDLRPSSLDFLGLMAALVGPINDLKEKDGIAAEVRAVGEVRRPAPEQELGLFRICQEALNNIRRHSLATRVDVEVEFLAGKVQMRINDNGRGFEVPERMDSLVSTGKLGILGMFERARLLGGTLAITSEKGQGTTVSVEVPTEPSEIQPSSTQSWKHS